jgi:hypothetical protein
VTSIIKMAQVEAIIKTLAYISLYYQAQGIFFNLKLLCHPQSRLRHGRSGRWTAGEEEAC